MDDEFVLLRPAILICAATLVLGVVIHACHQAAEQRARLEAMSSPSTGLVQSSAPCSARPVTACRTVTPESFSAGAAEASQP